jgi:hypothetical protein
MLHVNIIYVLRAADAEITLFYTSHAVRKSIGTIYFEEVKNRSLRQALLANDIEHIQPLC